MRVDPSCWLTPGRQTGEWTPNQLTAVIHEHAKRWGVNNATDQKTWPDQTRQNKNEGHAKTRSEHACQSVKCSFGIEHSFPGNYWWMSFGYWLEQWPKKERNPETQSTCWLHWWLHEQSLPNRTNGLSDGRQFRKLPSQGQQLRRPVSMERIFEPWLSLTRTTPCRQMQMIHMQQARNSPSHKSMRN